MGIGEGEPERMMSSEKVYYIHYVIVGIRYKLEIQMPCPTRLYTKLIDTHNLLGN